MKEIYQTKILFERTRKNQIQYWQGLVKTDGEKVYYLTNSWIEGGKKVKTSELTEVKRKNVGRSNETTEIEQAISEITSKLNKKIDEGYEYVDGTPIERKPFLYPMLASSLNDIKNLIFPQYIQYKYDGVRCLHDGKNFWSRNLKEFTSFQHLQFDTKGYIVDGEILLPPPYTFNDTISAIRTEKTKHDLSSQIVYHLYDVIDQKNPKMTYSERMELLKTFELPCGVSLAPTEIVENESQRKCFHDNAVSLGYEGTIGRIPSGEYLTKYRSKDLIKYKDFISEEFEIVGYEEGSGNHKGCIIFVCKTSNGVKFNATPKAPLEYRKKWLLDADNLIGKMVTVEFQPFTETQKFSPDGRPRFPRAITIRDYE